MSYHQQYLEAPYAARDAIEAAFAEWIDTEARAHYDNLVDIGEIAIIGFDSNGVEIVESFEDWCENDQADRLFDRWYNGE